MTKWMMVTVAGLMVSNMAWAGGLDKADVAADAKWVMHFDWAKYNASEIAKLIAAEQQHEAMQAKLQKMVDKLSFNPFTDIQSVTLYGNTYAHGDGVVLVKGGLKAEPLLALLDGNDSHKAETYGAHVVHTWVDSHHKRPGAAAFTGDNALVLAKTPEQVKAALDVLGKTKAALGNGGEGIAVPDSAPGVFFMAYATKCEGQLAGHSKMRIFSNADSMAFAVGESEGNLSFEMQLNALTPEKAALMHTVTQGMISFVSLAAERNPGAAEMAQAIKVQSEGTAVTVGMTKSSADLMAFVKAQAKQHGGCGHRRGRGSWHKHKAKAEADTAE